MTAIEVDDDGLVPATVRPAGGGEPVTVEIDLFEVFCSLGELVREYRDRPYAEHLGAVADLMQKLGFPRPTTLGAERFAVAVQRAVDGLKKKDPGGSTPDSSASTGSTPTG